MTDKPDTIHRADAIALCKSSGFLSVEELRALPAAQVVKALDLSNVQKHAFISCVNVARSIPPDYPCEGPSLWLDYDPGENPALARIRSALIDTPPAVTDDLAVLVEAVRAEIEARNLFLSTAPDRGGSHGTKGQRKMAWENAQLAMGFALARLGGVK